MKVCEIFRGIQGESTYAGVPCIFLRLTGCNLRCLYCDTAYAYEDGVELSEDEIAGRVAGYGIRTVEITGGEPLMQEGARQLIKRLLDSGYKVLLETNGSMEVAGVDRRAVIILDIKTPGSGMSEHNLLSNLSHLKTGDEVKFVITGRGDYEWAREFIAAYSLADKCSVLFSPAFGSLDPQQLAGWILEERLDVRLNLQLQKYIYGPDCRGV